MADSKEVRRVRRVIGRNLRRNRDRKQAARDRIKSENEKFLAKLDAMPDGLDPKPRP